MKHHTRRAIAYITGSVLSQNGRSSVYDHSTSKHYSFSGSCTPEQVSVYDHTESCHISGGLPNVYHHGNNKHISINMNGNSFTGYDYDEACHFSGLVNGNNVHVYDHGESSHFNYSV